MASVHLVMGCPNARAGAKVVKKQEFLQQPSATEISTPVTKLPLCGVAAGVALVMPILVGSCEVSVAKKKIWLEFLRKNVVHVWVCLQSVCMVFFVVTLVFLWLFLLELSHGERGRGEREGERERGRERERDR